MIDVDSSFLVIAKDVRQMTSPIRLLSAILLGILLQPAAYGQFGSALTGVGPINRSMGGASTAAPLDTLGALQWNPATITALPNSTDFGLELLFPNSTLKSSVKANSLAPGFPAADVAGSTRSESGVFPLPEFGVVFTPKNSDVTFGLGVLSVGGFGANYPGSATNPVLTPPLPNGMGVGPIYTQYQLLQFVPTVAFRLTDELSVGVSPIIDLASLSVDPGILAAPDNAGGSGFPTYPAMTHGAFQWGAGFQIGAFYVTDNYWQFGASFKSKQWFNDFSYNSSDQIGAPRNVKFGLDAPMIISLGTAYAGFERLLFAVDARYLAYSDTRGYSETGFTPTGAVAGLGWKDVFAVSAGTQYQMSDAVSARLGYSFNTNPIGDSQTFYNVGSPLIIQHGAYVGTSYNVNQCFKVSITYAHFFENSVSGPIQSPGGAIPGTNASSSAFADSLIVGASFTF